MVTGASNEICYVWCLGWGQERVEGKRAGFNLVSIVREGLSGEIM